jgi:DNA-binding transcriptional regulator YbjK
VLASAAAALLAEGGLAAVSHRAVAERAGLPLAATTYYYRSRDELVTHAFARLVERELRAWRCALAGGRGAHDAAAAVDLLVGVLCPTDPEVRARQLAIWELYLQAGRDPNLRSIAGAWAEGCIAIAAGLLQDLGFPSEAARLLVLALGGVLLQNLVEQRTDARVFTQQAVLAVLEAASRTWASRDASSSGSW